MDLLPALLLVIVLIIAGKMMAVILQLLIPMSLLAFLALTLFPLAIAAIEEFRVGRGRGVEIVPVPNRRGL